MENKEAFGCLVNAVLTVVLAYLIIQFIIGQVVQTEAARIIIKHHREANR